jgi:hypothetical protein
MLTLQLRRKRERDRLGVVFGEDDATRALGLLLPYIHVLELVL